MLLDTDFLVAYWNRDETRHDEANRLFRELVTGGRGRLFVTDYIVDEAATLAMRRVRDVAKVRAFVRFLLGAPPAPGVLGLLHVGPDQFQAASERFLRITTRRLSFTDCTSLEVLEARSIEAIATFDSGFRGFAHVIPE